MATLASKCVGKWGAAAQGMDVVSWRSWRRGAVGQAGVLEVSQSGPKGQGLPFSEIHGETQVESWGGQHGQTASGRGTTIDLEELPYVNECGVKPRPCQHRCVNTHGSYKCFCLSGHMLMPDATCANIDECASSKAVCPYNRRCVNTFGSYYCKCHVGFELKYISGRYDCIDVNECAMNTRMCSLHANCLNTQGSFRCKCKQGYKGNGFQCSVIPENSVREVLRVPGTIKDRIKKLLAHKNSMKKKVKIKNVTPGPTGTLHPKVNLQPFSYEETVSRNGNSSRGKKRNEERMKEGLGEEKREEKVVKNDVEQEQSLRGDVFFPKVNEAGDFGLVLIQKVPNSKLEQKDLNVSVDCSFDHGVCDWKQDREDDFDWNPADRDNAVGYYMAVPALVGHRKDIGRLKLLLPDLQPQNNFCLLFDYRLAGDKVGKLRVFVKNSNNVLAWEETKSEDERWKTGKIQLYQGIDTTKSVIFEAERGKGKTGEIAVDSVLLVSGLCPDGLLSAEG
ncbi:Epidermal growth factor-like protein 6 [Sciurus carolinensis]|uniref:Epidermal growth factor-like protein 6 n=1 Tax=Sciurus carolinensis TaxID=30640 RepID=A0AA41MDV2_SCICA|nr:Epidermal growth factor-like protein 6 [Sciurus carolinensis]